MTAPAARWPARRTARIALVCGLLIVAVLSLVPSQAVPSTGLWDKTEHMLAYGVLTVCGLVAYRGQRPASGVVAFLLAYGGGLEALQALAPGRVPQWSDWLANAIGIAAAALLVPAVRWLVGHRGKVRG